ncbi:MAG: ATP-binding protein [Deltaproteobacteria bacterium]|nr:ATP-binding protein [Deltaproteobacteria bacterium]
MPIVKYISVNAPPPSLQDNSADIDRLKNALRAKVPGFLVVPFAQMSNVAAGFRQAKFSGTAVVNEAVGCPESRRLAYLELVDFIREPAPLAAMALDLGTTHLEATLLDLTTSKPLARANRENSQLQFGEDVLSRIHYAARPGGLANLQSAIIADINYLAADLAAQAGLPSALIRALSVSGNPTMIHLFLKLDPANICREPYIPVLNAPDLYHAADLGLCLHPAAPVFVLPSVGSYFGGDLIAGILASGLDENEHTSMLIDVGTNAEVVLGNKDWLIACAGAAGPALEGGVARMGMRAGPGAIEHIRIKPGSLTMSYETVGGQPACGICGSGIIDLVASLYLAGIIDLRGKFRPGSDSRLHETPTGLSYTVVPTADAANNRAIELEQVDLDAMMRSKAAMYAVLTTLISQVGLSFADLEKIYVAGAFGRHIDPERAVTLGMLPDLPIKTYVPVGNSSLAGAEKVLLGSHDRQRCQQIMQKITYIELNVNQEFMMRFSGAKFIPHTDGSLFPSVPIMNE